MVPSDLCKHLLHKSSVRPGGGKRAHVLQVARRQPPHVREGPSEIVGKTIDYPGVPTFPPLPVENRSPYVPVQQHERRVGRQHDTQALLADALLDLGEGGRVVGRQPGARRPDREGRALPLPAPGAPVVRVTRSRLGLCRHPSDSSPALRRLCSNLLRDCRPGILQIARTGRCRSTPPIVQPPVAQLHDPNRRRQTEPHHIPSFSKFSWIRAARTAASAFRSASSAWISRIAVAKSKSSSSSSGATPT